MTVSELRHFLADEDPDRIVIISSDPEGNRFHRVSDAYMRGAYKSGDVGLEELTPEKEAQGYSQEDLMTDGKPCLVLYPE